MRPEQLLDSLPRAIRTLTDPVETGPVVLSLPQDVQVESYPYPIRFFERREWPIARPRADEDALRIAAERINAARRPLIVAGGGIRYSKAESELIQLAEAAGIPVVETFAGKGAMRSTSPMALGALGVAGTTVANATARRADLVVAAGTRLSDFITGSQSAFQNPEVQFLGLNINSADANKYGAFAVVGDLRQSLGQLIPLVAGHDRSERSGYLGEVASLRDEWRGLRAKAVASEAAPPLRQTEVVGILNEFVRPGDTIVTSAGTLPGDIFRYWEIDTDKKCHIEFGYSCMGYDIAGAVGVKLAQSDAEVYAVLGDATFILSPADLAVAVQHRLKITLIVCDNQGMQSIRGLERRLVAHPYANIFEFRDRLTYESSGPVGFDVARIGEGLGAAVFAVGTRAELQAALEAAREEGRPCLIVVKSDTSRGPSRDEVWWDIAPAEVSESAEVAELRTTYQRRRQEQRFHY
jgi:3D-(3,5/4)-trihydroxycyclohexane-1,2-dione acylhydrolase (decyclizing)